MKFVLLITFLVLQIQSGVYQQFFEDFLCQEGEPDNIKFYYEPGACVRDMRKPSKFMQLNAAQNDYDLVYNCKDDNCTNGCNELKIGPQKCVEYETGTLNIGLIMHDGDLDKESDTDYFRYYFANTNCSMDGQMGIEVIQAFCEQHDMTWIREGCDGDKVMHMEFMIPNCELDPTTKYEMDMTCQKGKDYSTLLSCKKLE